MNSRFTSAFTHSAFSIVLALAVLHAQDGRVSPTWPDLAPLHTQLDARGIGEAAFPAYVDRLRQTHADARARRRSRPPGLLSPAVAGIHHASRPSSRRSARRRWSKGSSVKEREAFLRTGAASVARVPDAVRARIGALLRALGAPSRDARILYFGELVQATFPQAGERADRPVARVPAGDALRLSEGVRRPAVAQARRSRLPSSTDRAASARIRPSKRDTSSRSGSASSSRWRRNSASGECSSSDPVSTWRRERRSLEVGPPQSYQPWAVMDALVANGLSRLDDLEVVAADINPRVVAHIRRARSTSRQR